MMATHRMIGRRVTRRLALGAMIAALLAALAPIAGATTVTLRETAQVAGAQVTLGEISAIADADVQTTARLRAVAVGAAPLAGRSRPLSLDSVRVQLRRAGFDPEALHLTGAQRVTVTRAAATVTGGEIEAAAREAVLAQHPEEGELTVTCPRPPKDVVVPQGKVSLQPQVIGAGRGPTRLVRVMIAVDASPVTSATVCLRVERYDDLLVAARDIPRGEALAPEAFALERRDVMQVMGAPLRDLAAIAGCRAKLRLSAGAVLTTQSVERIPVIHRGDPVIVTLSAGAVRVTLQGIARSDAGVGETVMLLNPSSKREFAARATGQGAAEVTLGLTGA